MVSCCEQDHAKRKNKKQYLPVPGPAPWGHCTCIICGCGCCCCTTVPCWYLPCVPTTLPPPPRCMFCCWGGRCCWPCGLRLLWWPPPPLPRPPLPNASRCMGVENPLPLVLWFLIFNSLLICTPMHPITLQNAKSATHETASAASSQLGSKAAAQRHKQAAICKQLTHRINFLSKGSDPKL